MKSPYNDMPRDRTIMSLSRIFKMADKIVVLYSNKKRDFDVMSIGHLIGRKISISIGLEYNMAGGGDSVNKRNLS